MSDEPREKTDSGRRDFLKKSLVTGAVVWGAPAVTSLPGGRAWAQTYEPCTCNADGYGLSLSLLGGPPTIFGQNGSVVNVNVPIPVVGGSVVATAVTGSATDSIDGACSGLGQIAAATVTVGPSLAPQLVLSVTVLTATASANCQPCATTGSSTIATASASGSLVGGNIDVLADATCNTDVLGLGIIVVNEQSCDANPGTLSVNALHVTVPGVIDLILGHAEAGALGTTDGCPCHECT
jgi:hypothetical protein